MWNGHVEHSLKDKIYPRLIYSRLYLPGKKMRRQCQMNTLYDEIKVDIEVIDICSVLKVLLIELEKEKDSFHWQ